MLRTFQRFPQGSVQLKALLDEEETALPLQSEDKDGRKISSRIEAATNSEEEDRSERHLNTELHLRCISRL